MRSCPHCSRQIQDEAIYCRYCRRDVEPALWISAMRKCPYCAEWIEIEAETCHYCGRDSVASPVEATPPFVDFEPEEYSQQLRRTLLTEEAPPAEPARGPTEAPAAQVASLRQRAQEPELAPEPMPRRQSRPGPAQRSATEDSGELPRDSLWASAVEASPIFRAQPPERLRPRTAGLARAGVAISVVLGLGVLLIVLAQGPAAAFVRGALATSTPTPTEAPLPTGTPRVAPTLPPLAETVQAPPPTKTPVPDCLPWDQVGVEDEGRELCVYGVIKRWFAAEEIPFVAIFSEEPGTFAIIDRTTSHPVGPGDCILARGEVVIMSGTRPHIDAAGELQACPAELQPP